MINISDCRINIDESQLKQIIDAFVSVYGEERRQEIEKKIYSIKFFIFKPDEEFKKQQEGIDTKEIRDLKENLIVDELKDIDFLSPLDKKEMDNIIRLGGSFCGTELAHTKNGIGPVHFICVNIESEVDCADHVIFHEINHALETSIVIPESGDTCIVKSGWEQKNVSMKDGSIEPMKLNEFRCGDHELFNEIINDLVAEQAVRKFHEQGHRIASDPKKAVYSYAWYRDVEFLVKDFFDRYREDIMKSRTGESTELFDKIGLDNFEELNGLVNKYETSYRKIKGRMFFPRFRDTIKTEFENLKKSVLPIKKTILEKMGIPTEEKSTAMGM